MTWRRHWSALLKVCRWHQTGGSSWCAWRQGWHPEGPKPAGGMGQRNLKRFSKAKAYLCTWRKESLAMIQAGNWQSVEQLGRKDPGVPGGQWDKHKPAMPWQQRVTTAFWAALVEVEPAHWRKALFPSTQQYLDHS